jgi:hypothetical protein
MCPDRFLPGDLIAFREGNPSRVLALLPTAPGSPAVGVLADRAAFAIAAG